MNPLMAAKAYAAIQGGASPTGPVQAPEQSGFAQMLTNVMGDMTQASRAAETQMASAVQGQGSLIDVVTAVSRTGVGRALEQSDGEHARRPLAVGPVPGRAVGGVAVLGVDRLGDDVAVRAQAEGGDGVLDAGLDRPPVVVGPEPDRDGGEEDVLACGRCDRCAEELVRGAARVLVGDDGDGGPARRAHRRGPGQHGAQFR